MSIGKYLILLITPFALVSCRNEMHDQPKAKSYRASAIFDDSLSMRPVVEGTVARGYLRADPLYDQGKMIDASGKSIDAATFPFPVTKTILDRGQERFNIYCSPCHGMTGEGDGMVVRRGFRPPPSYHMDRLRTATPGHFFDVISNGFGTMPDYAMQLSPADRWAVVAYVKALQVSQHATVAEIPPPIRSELDAPKTATAAPSKPE